MIAQKFEFKKRIMAEGRILKTVKSHKVSKNRHEIWYGDTV